LVAAGNVGELQHACRSAHVAPLPPPAPVVVIPPPAPVVPGAPPAPVEPELEHCERHLLNTQLPMAAWQLMQAGGWFITQFLVQAVSLQAHALVQAVSAAQSPPEKLPLAQLAP
jgi:hypothetical protein